MASSSSLSRNELQAQLADYYTQVVGATHPIDSTQYFAQFTDGSRDILRGYVESVEDINEASVDGIVAYQERALSEMGGGAAKYINGLKNIFGNFLLIVGSQIAIRLGEALWERLPFTDAHKQKIAKLAEEAVSAFDEGLKKNTDNSAAVEQISAEFKKLAAGVSQTGENLSLTNEQYDTYKSYVEKLIEINPALVQGINSQGDAFINNKTAIEETTKALKEQQRAIYANFFNGKDNKDVLDHLIDQYEDSVGKIDKDLGFQPSLTHQILENFQRNRAIGTLDPLSKLLTKVSEEEKTRLLQSLGIDDGNLWTEINSNTEEFARRVEQNRQEILDLAHKYGEDKWVSSQLDDNRDLLIQLDQEREQLERVGTEFDDYVDKYARSRDKYYDLSAQQTHILDSLIKSYNFSDKMFADGADTEMVERQMRTDVDSFIEFLNGLSDETTNKMTELFSLDKDSLSYNDWKIQVNKIIKEIMDDPNYNQEILPEEQLRVQLGVAIETNDGQIEDEYLNAIDRVTNRLKQDRSNYNKDFGLMDGTIISKLHDLTPNQISKLDSTEDLSQFDSWQAIEDFLNGAQEFDIKSYQDTIDDIVKDLDKLGEANAKLINGDLTPNADGAVKYVMELAKEFPELNKYIDYGAENFGNLGKGIEDVIQHRPDSLLKMWDSLGNLTDSARRDVDNYRKAIKKLQEDAMGGDLTWISRLGLTEQDYLNYVVKDYDKIIKRLQDEKDGLSDVNDELTEQKEKLDKIVDEYKIAGDTVIKQLDDKISDVNDYYDEQIDKLKTENEELERSLELQQKQAALANAQKRKVRVLTETEGWVWKNDNQGIRNAEKDLKDTETNIRVAELEKQRDDEIKLWEDYKDAWQDAMDAYTKAHDEAITDGILGSGWRDNVMARDEDMLNNYEVSYSNFQYRLNDDIGKQIEANNEYEKSIDKKIKKYEDDKKAIQDWVDEQEESNDRYFGLLDEVKVTENSTWNERLANFEEFKNNFLAIKAQLENEDISKMYAVEFNGKTAGFYNSESEARAAAKSLVNAKVNYATANNPSARTSSNIAHLRDEAERLIRILAPGSYSNGGVIDYTGVANVHGSPNKSEVALNSSQAGEVYSFIKSGMLSKATDAMTAAYNSLIDLLPKPKLGNLINPMLNLPRGTGNVVESKPLETSNEINISFAGATINAESYESFKDYMDRYTGNLLLQLQTGKK